MVLLLDGDSSCLFSISKIGKRRRSRVSNVCAFRGGVGSAQWQHCSCMSGRVAVGLVRRGFSMVTYMARSLNLRGV